MVTHETTPEWRPPRIGQWVKLRGGKTVQVAVIRRCNDILRALKDDEAKVLGARLKATYGIHWQKLYYEADAYIGSAPVSFQPNDVVEVLDTRI